MRQWVIAYVADYTSMDPIALDVPGPIRKIISGFYIENNITTAFPLAPEVVADADNDVQISDPATDAGRRAVKIFIAAGLTHALVFLFIEVELEVPGTHRPITA